MPVIRVLPDELVNRIAAGEVVERPASVVKELVENSLDAGASRVEVDLAHGGRSLVRVADDGCGMDGDDALLALERHATSKLTSSDELHRIATLGFRGEALPSIAAVSRFELSTCADPERGGTRVEVEGGRVRGATPVPRSRGTTVEVADLFFNLPARRKFLAAPETELRHAQETVVATALARPDVTFLVRHLGRVLLELPAVADPASRLADLARRGSGRVVRFTGGGGEVQVDGLLALSEGSGRPAVTFIVNGRPVRDRLLVGAVSRVLREVGSGLGGSRVVISVRVPPEAVDVNVHPAKAEVRFARSGAVFAAVERALRDGVARSHGAVGVRRVEAPEWPERLQPPRVAEPFRHPVYADPAASGAAAPGTAAPAVVPLFPAEPPAAPGTAPETGAATPFGRLIGQYRASFLLLEDADGLVIVDQHVAHERVLYDRIRRQLEGAAAPRQRLLEPVLLEVGEPAAAAAEHLTELLGRVGIELDRFGADTVRLVALPPDLRPAAAAALVEELLDRATALDGVPERVAEELDEALAAGLSCRSAVTVNTTLAPEKQRLLLAELAGASDPYRCPHGRPIVLRLSQVEMERRFGRR